MKHKRFVIMVHVSNDHETRDIGRGVLMIMVEIGGTALLVLGEDGGTDPLFVEDDVDVEDSLDRAT